MSSINIKANELQPQEKSNDSYDRQDPNQNQNSNNYAKPNNSKYSGQSKPKRQQQRPVLEHAKPDQNFYEKDGEFQQEGEQVGNKEEKQTPVKLEKKFKPGVIMKIVKYTEKKKVAKRIYIEVRNESNLVEGQRGSRLSHDSKRTKEVESKDAKWDDNFYYNSSQVLDDNITFILRNDHNQELARSEIKNFSERNVDLKSNEVQKKEITLKNQKQELGFLYIQVSFFEKEDLVGGIKIPNLSLRPHEGFKPKYNAVDGYNPVFTKENGRRGNCFNFLDSDTIPGFDAIELFPSKFVQPNKIKKQSKQDLGERPA